MKNFKIKSYCKINLSLKVIKKLKNGYHNLESLITFCDLYDSIFISEIKKHKDIITFSGKFKYGVNKNSNTITKTLSLLRKEKLIKNRSFKIDIKKNIPHGAGLGGASSNAASLLNFFNEKMKLNLNKANLINLAKKIGFDVPINLEKKNTFLNGTKNHISRLNQKFRLNLLIVYPNIICSTKNIFKKNKKISSSKFKSFNNKQNRKKLINYLKNERNDLENTVVKIYPKIEKTIGYIKSQNGCIFSRITGSGSACIGIFSNRVQAISAKKMVRLKYPKYWSVVSKTI